VRPSNVEAVPITEVQVDPDAFRTALGSFATGVSVMTTVVGDVPHGMTASAVSSVSLEPPLVLVCVDREASMATRALDAGVFALSFLGEDQGELATAFADPARPEGEEQFVGVATRAQATGAPVLHGNVGWVDCRLWSVTDGGDHVVLIGEVVALGSDGDRPLLYYRGAYGEFRAAELAEPEAIPDTGGAS
jgi:flavin reductase